MGRRRPERWAPPPLPPLKELIPGTGITPSLPDDELFARLQAPGIAASDRAVAYRLLAGLTYRQAAERLGGLAEHVHMIEQGRRRPPPGYLTWLIAAARARRAGAPLPPAPPIVWNSRAIDALPKPKPEPGPKPDGRHEHGRGDFSVHLMIPAGWLPMMAARAPSRLVPIVGAAQAYVERPAIGRTARAYLFWFLHLLDREGERLAADPRFTPARRALLGRIAPHLAVHHHLMAGQVAITDVLPELLSVAAQAAGLPRDAPEVADLIAFVTALGPFERAALIDTLYREWVARQRTSAARMVAVTRAYLALLAGRQGLSSSTSPPSTSPDG